MTNNAANATSMAPSHGTYRLTPRAVMVSRIRVWPDSFITPDSAMSRAGIQVASSGIVIGASTVTVEYLGIVNYYGTRRKTALFSSQVTLREPHDATVCRARHANGASRLRVSGGAGSGRRQMEPARDRHARRGPHPARTVLGVEAQHPRHFAADADRD